MATTDIYTLSLYDALPIYSRGTPQRGQGPAHPARRRPEDSYCAAVPTSDRDPTVAARRAVRSFPRSEEHTSELQSHSDLVCRLLLEKKNEHTRRLLSRR